MITVRLYYVHDPDLKTDKLNSTKGYGERGTVISPTFYRIYSLVNKISSKYLVHALDTNAIYTFFQYWLSAMQFYRVNRARTGKQGFEERGVKDIKYIQRNC